MIVRLNECMAERVTDKIAAAAVQRIAETWRTPPGFEAEEMRIAQTRLLIDEIRHFPARVVTQALRDLMRTKTWWPAIAEVMQACDVRFVQLRERHFRCAMLLAVGHNPPEDHGHLTWEWRRRIYRLTAAAITNPAAALTEQQGRLM